MKFPEAFLDKVKASFRLSEYVARTVVLKRQGGEFVGLSPFTKEKTPSFYVNDDKRFFHCLSGDTRVIVRGGSRPIRELAGGVHRILTKGGRWVDAPFHSYGVQPVYEITLTRNGREKRIRATAGHRWFVLKGEGRKDTKEILTTELKPGARLAGIRASRDGRTFPSPFGVAHGFVFGDGYLTKRGSRAQFCGPKDEEMKRFFLGANELNYHDRSVIDGLPMAFKGLPDLNESPAYLYGFVAGYIAADGCVDKKGSASLASANLANLEAVRPICDLLGIVMLDVKTQTGGGYAGGTMHQANFARSTIGPEAFVLSHHRARFEASERRHNRSRWTVKAVSAAPVSQEEVFCAEVPGTHSFGLDGNILTGNCFSSGKHGDIVDWLTETEGLTFVEAVKRLAGEAGLELPEQTPEAAHRDSRRRHLENILGAAQTYFLESLRSPDGHRAVTYLGNRGVTMADCERFGIGFAPDVRTGLVEALRAYGPGDLLAAGVAVLPEGQSRPYDRYRGRITFPISDVAGHPVSFGARALDPKAKAKYLNGPDTDLFDKGRNLYGLDMSRKLLAAGPAPLIVVEGYMDVIACLRAGIPACAPMGTSLTDHQLDLLWRFHPEPTMCFDGDQAGRRAASRSMDMAIPKIGSGRSMQFCFIVNGKDPDEVLRTRGPDALRAQLTKTTPLAKAIFERERDLGPLDTPERRSDLRERLYKISRAIGDRGVAREYGDAFKVHLDALRRQPTKEAAASTASVEAARALHTAIPPVARALAYWLVKDPSRSLDDIEALDLLGLGHEGLDDLIQAAVGWLAGHEPDGEKLTQHLHAKGMGDMVVSLGDPGHRFADPKTWQETWRRRAAYLRLDAEVREVKRSINGPDAMRRFIDLKSQRDLAKAAL